YLMPRNPRGTGHTFRLSILPPEGVTLNERPALSPDGHYLAFVGTDTAGHRALWLRPLDGDARPLTGTNGAMWPFWSPDGRTIAYFADDKLKKIGLSGEPSETLCDARDARGGSWGSAGWIVFSANSGLDGIYRVPANGGMPTRVTTRGTEGAHRWPQFLPD